MCSNGGQVTVILRLGGNELIIQIQVIRLFKPVLFFAPSREHPRWSFKHLQSSTALRRPRRKLLFQDSWALAIRGRRGKERRREERTSSDTILCAIQQARMQIQGAEQKQNKEKGRSSRYPTICLPPHSIPTNTINQRDSTMDDD